jgi:hypothetical protein
MQILEGSGMGQPTAARQSATGAAEAIWNVSTKNRSDRIRNLESLILDTEHLYGTTHNSRARGFQQSRHDSTRAEYVGYLSFPGTDHFAETMQLRSQTMQQGSHHKRRLRPVTMSQQTEVETTLDTESTYEISEDTTTATCVTELSTLIASGKLNPDRLAKLARILEIRAYEVRPTDALRAIALINEGAYQLESLGHRLTRDCPGHMLNSVMASDRVVVALRASLQSLVAAVSIQLLQGHAGTARLYADALMAMAITRTGRQEQLDAFMAKLAYLLEREPHAFTPPIVATVAVALGKMWQIGGLAGCRLSAHEGSNEVLARRNILFCSVFNRRLLEVAPVLNKQEMSDVIETYGKVYLDDEQRANCLRHAPTL